MGARAGLAPNESEPRLPDFAHGPSAAPSEGAGGVCLPLSPFLHLHLLSFVSILLTFSSSVSSFISQLSSLLNFVSRRPALLCRVVSSRFPPQFPLEEAGTGVCRMATAQKQRSSVSAVVFPKKIATEQQSLMLVKRLLAVAVSCITYLRGIFPESAYGTRYMDDVCVKILREDKNCPGSTQLVKWLLGCYDALQKKYLRQIVLAVYTQTEDPQTVTECYHFKFKYTHNGPLLDFGSKDKNSDSTISCADTKKASILLIRKIYVLMQNLSPLPNDVCLTMKLLYYDEVTPPDYQPPGFKEAKDEGLLFKEEPMYLNVGEVPTPFHLLKLKITTEKQRMENVDKSILKQGETAEPRQVPKEESQDMNEDPVLDNEVEDKNNVNISEAQEKNSAKEEEAGGFQTPLSVSNPQVDHLTRKTSELIVSESRTRSGKIFQSCIVHPAELSSSQEVLPKRRKLSEPKEQF